MNFDTRFEVLNAQVTNKEREVKITYDSKAQALYIEIRPNRGKKFYTEPVNTSDGVLLDKRYEGGLI